MINRVYIKFAMLFIAITILFLILNSDDISVLMGYGGCILILNLLFIKEFNKRISIFFDSLGEIIDKLINKNENITFQENRETIISKLEGKLKRLVEILENDRLQANLEKENIKILIADISHQIKTPIANLKIYEEMIESNKFSKEKEELFVQNIKVQINKLEWLIDSLIKMSRLDSNIIVLYRKNDLINKTIAEALSSIYLKGEEKKIIINVNCDSKLRLYHDRKWIREALFNIIDNSVKYTNEKGKIEISVEQMSVFTKIDIIDSGIGIKENEINNIFKRFYRGENAHEKEGVGIGLYLANEIIIKHGGYIQVLSKIGEGSKFSVFLQN